MKNSKIDTPGLPDHRILGQILYNSISRGSSGSGILIADLRRELQANECVARAYPHNLQQAIANSLRRQLWNGTIIRDAGGLFQVSPLSAVQSTAGPSSTQQASSMAAAASPPSPPARASHSSTSQHDTKGKATYRTRDEEEDDDGSASRKRWKSSETLSHDGSYHSDSRHAPFSTTSDHSTSRSSQYRTDHHSRTRLGSDGHSSPARLGVAMGMGGSFPGYHSAASSVHGYQQDSFHKQTREARPADALSDRGRLAQQMLPDISPPFHTRPPILTHYKSTGSSSSSSSRDSASYSSEGGVDTPTSTLDSSRRLSIARMLWRPIPFDD
ncbi:unnamed protein product [Tilletia laevis]|uniref:Uncharacterized protein n=2 Tax=Tilletia TaxID=13289 RepID=A0A177UK39_9BASI|nr:hypothetical protein A4X03_0g4825 [Tilletia caries]CAD6918144.1 unnamed protein product [Tilletia laevis]CAD6925075.1 unnamed protein product [Tilletia controversa]CAD6884401.1 unnamed protein product [Tilletia caries]CAD6904085.1 unnamed protein product [Tilletia caries]